MIAVGHNIKIAEEELVFRFVRASGPGGQNVNKVATAVQLRFDVQASTLPRYVKDRLIKLAGSRVSRDGVLIIDARCHRTQERNRQDALSRLQTLVERAAHRPKQRLKTKPSKAAKERRLKEKRVRSQRKKGRKSFSPDD